MNHSIKNIIINPGLFNHFPQLDKKKERKKISDNISGPHLYLRKIKVPIQARLAELISHHNIPSVFLFGSPHLDNYCRTQNGVGLIDFDRALYGPYISDITYCLLSMELKQQDIKKNLDKSVYQKFKKTYLDYLTNEHEEFIKFKPLETAPLAHWEKSITDYISHDKSWYKKAEKNSIPIDEPLVIELVRQYFVNRNESSLVNEYKIEFAGLANGSMGRPHTIILLENIRDKHLKLIDLKPAKNYRESTWSHGKYYNHPFDHEGQRMVEASKLLAPNITLNESYATINGCQYWGREISAINKKFKIQLDDKQLLEFTDAAASQIGSGHRKSIQTHELENLSNHCQKNFDQLSEAIATIKQELLASWQHYVKLCEKYK